VTADPLELAAELAAALRGSADRLRDLLATRNPGAWREAATLIEEAEADPIAFAADHGDRATARVRPGGPAVERLHRVFRRDDALEALYASEQLGGGPDTAGLSNQAAELAEAVWEARHALDEAIGEVAEGWTVSRMAPVDRNVLRIGLWELLNRPETPVAVVASEAVRLAKAYSTEHSGRFVNGVLGALAERVRPG
jgi:N utilization substance protein B